MTYIIYNEYTLIIKASDYYALKNILHKMGQIDTSILWDSQNIKYIYDSQ